MQQVEETKDFTGTSWWSLYNNNNIKLKFKSKWSINYPWLCLSDTGTLEHQAWSIEQDFFV